jgi:hypothetical protein
MEALVDQRTSQSVGAIAGCIVRVTDARISKELEYLQSGEVGVSPEEGQTGFSILASNITPAHEESEFTIEAVKLDLL